MASNTYFRLLDLPPDVVQCITDFLSPETLIAVRQTCRTLEALTFERFGNSNFADHYAFVLSASPFMRLIKIINAPRVRRFVRNITMGLSILEDQPVTAIHTVQREGESLRLAQHYARSALYRKSPGALTRSANTDCCMMCSHCRNVSW